MNHKLFFFACALNLFYYVPNLLASPVIGGEEDDTNAHKYQVNIYRNFLPPTADHVCGGAIVSNYHVLAGAHCFMVKENGRIIRECHPRREHTVVSAGTHLTRGLRLVLHIEKVYIPHVYEHGRQPYADIAVAKVAGNFNVAGNARILRPLQIDEEPRSEVYDNEYAVIAGNGCNGYRRNNDGELVSDPTKIPEKRQVLLLLILPRDNCHVYDHAICAANDDTENIRTCADGDSGGPLVYGDTVIGVLSTAPRIFRRRPQILIFTRVAKFNDFIRKAMDESGDHREMYVCDD